MSYYAIILAGGRATRFQGQLKHFFTIGGIPIIVHIIKTILRTNVKKIFIVINNLWQDEHSEEIKNYIGNKVEFEFIIQEKIIGTAKSAELIFTTSNIDKKNNLLVFYGDTPFVQSININNVNDKLDKGAEGLCNSFYNFNPYNPDNYDGKLIIDKNNKPIEVVEYKKYLNNHNIVKSKYFGGGIFASKIYILEKLLPLVKKCEYSQEYSIFSLIEIAYKLNYNFIHLPIERWEAIGCNNYEELAFAEAFYQKNLDKFIK